MPSTGHEYQAGAYAIATELGTGLAVREVVFVYPRAGAERALARGELPSALGADSVQ